MQDWKPKYQKGATYLSKVDDKKYFINYVYELLLRVVSLVQS